MSGSISDSLMDSETARRHVQYADDLLKKDPNSTGIQAHLFQAEAAAGDQGWYVFYPEPETNQELNEVCLVLQGEGSFPPYWGLMDDGEVVCLVLDCAEIV